MRFVLLLHEDEQVWARAGATERADHVRRHDAFSEAVRARGELVGGEALSAVAAATTVRRDAESTTVTEGPYAETVEQLGGFYVVDLPDLDAVLEAVALLPPYSVEVRPVVDLDDR
ncbi:YciI family protein [Cellulosimicrobium arenosum]|uniref:YCII-related domain-containing protein n=1 Tax=Cellulosimicrobium arenosum TaxID=2708133 RepID=A0A927G8L5_9MICO|nr:YciI family protein [Cellulosimicrobium arenosum]MBD8078886.1 hypothetical protein [Cellulosimicrobium arenosum]